MPFDHPNRPWPTPSRPHALVMNWHHLLFMHWPIPASLLRPLVPASLEVDTFDGSAWIGIVPFRMSGTRPRFLPPVPLISNFPELNVRTYVTAGGKPGVWFFSLDASSVVAVQGARKMFHLNYCNARMACEHDAESGVVNYRSVRTHRGMPPAEFIASYRAVGPAFNSTPGTLEHFLTERYCLYSASPSGRTYRGEIAHAPWPLKPAEATIERNTMLDQIGSATPAQPPLLHLGGDHRVAAWWLEEI